MHLALSCPRTGNDSTSDPNAAIKKKGKKSWANSSTLSPGARSRIAIGVKHVKIAQTPKVLRKFILLASAWQSENAVKTLALNSQCNLV
jgi:hypothetical protein